MTQQPIIRTELYQTIPIIPYGTYSAGTITKKLWVEGGAILSTLFVKDIPGGSGLTVTYKEATTGEDDGESTTLASHVTPSNGLADKIVVANIHNKPTITATITGVSAKFGVYVTIIPAGSSSVDLSGSLVKDGQISNLVTDLGFTQAIYDPVAGKFFFAQGTNGVQNVYIAGGILAATALRVGGRFQRVTVTSATWTALPSIPLLDRKQLNIQNQSTTEVALNYDPLLPGYEGILMAERDRNNYTIEENIVVYAKAQTGTAIIGVEELA